MGEKVKATESKDKDLDSLRKELQDALKSNTQNLRNAAADSELTDKSKAAEDLAERLKLKLAHSVEEIEHLKDKIDDHQTEMAGVIEQVNTKTNEVRELEKQIDELKESARRDEILKSKQKLRKSTDQNNQSMDDKLGDLELENAELESEIETLKK